MESFCVSVRQFSMAVCTLTESAAQSAYLVGIADKASEPGKPGLVDQSQFSRANQAIQQACQTLASPTSSQSQVRFSPEYSFISVYVSTIFLLFKAL